MPPPDLLPRALAELPCEVPTASSAVAAAPRSCALGSPIPALWPAGFWAATLDWRSAGVGTDATARGQTSALLEGLAASSLLPGHRPLRLAARLGPAPRPAESTAARPVAGRWTVAARHGDAAPRPAAAPAVHRPCRPAGHTAQPVASVVQAAGSARSRSWSPPRLCPGCLPAVPVRLLLVGRRALTTARLLRDISGAAGLRRWQAWRPAAGLLLTTPAQLGRACSRQSKGRSGAQSPGHSFHSAAGLHIARLLRLLWLRLRWARAGRFPALYLPAITAAGLPIADNKHRRCPSGLPDAIRPADHLRVPRFDWCVRAVALPARPSLSPFLRRCARLAAARPALFPAVQRDAASHQQQSVPACAGRHRGRPRQCADG